VGDGTGNSCDTPEQVVGSLCSQVPICGNSQVEQGEECDDGNNTSDDGCTWNCLIEKCFGIVCKTLDTCHGVGGCDPATGACSNPVLDDGTQCDDHNGCTYDEKCSNGECKNGKPVICEGPPNCDPVTCDATIGKCATPTGCVGAEPIAQSLFQESWESGADGWTDSSGNPVTPATDSTSPAGAGVQKIDTSSTSYQSPWIPVQGGQQYCVAAYVRWVSGSWPFIGIQRHYEAGQTPPAVDWLIGQGSYPNSQFAPLTPVSATDPNWQYVSHTVSMPADVSQVRLVDELWDGDTKGGSELAYFDGLAIDNGACQTAVPETIYQQWWETDTAGWKDQSGKAATLVSDPTSPAGPNAQFIGPSTPAGPYSSPSVSLTAGSPYCVTSSVRWLGGQPPFVGVKFSNSATPTGLVGGDSGATVSTDTNWQTFSETILVPDSAGSAPSLQLVDGISTGASNPKPGDNQSYFDNISITAGPCQRRPSLEPAIVLASTIAGSSGTTPGRLDGTSR
jgi:cysteine-rich repeat protein